jgi:hypothetical protein
MVYFIEAGETRYAYDPVGNLTKQTLRDLPSALGLTKTFGLRSILPTKPLCHLLEEREVGVWDRNSYFSQNSPILWQSNNSTYFFLPLAMSLGSMMGSSISLQ